MRAQFTRSKTIPGHRRGDYRPWLTTLVLMLGGLAACSDTPAALEEEEEDPPAQGSIVLTVSTSGLFKDDGYELVVNGESQGAIAADDTVTVAELDLGMYDVSLQDVAENCTASSDSVEVASEEAVLASLTVSCTYSSADPYTVRFSRERPNLDNGEITECPFGLCPTSEGWDFYVHYNSSTDPHAVIRQNQSISVETAHLPGVTLETLTEEDLDGAVFTTDLVTDPFDAERVILIKTDLGAIYALGNPVENDTAQTLSFDAALVGLP